MDQLNNLKSILISNTRPYSDSNSIAADLAEIIAKKGKRVALIDADLRHPYMHKIFGIPNHNGLVDILTGKLPASKVIQQVKPK
jgi:Mrp family chromosome partitioning ATPase